MVETAVFYLLRHGNAPHHFTCFLDSIERNPAGRPFILYIIQKGYPANYTHPLIDDWRRRNVADTDIISVPDEIGLDIHAYFAGANRVEQPRCLFFNSYSRILHPNWLAHYARAFEALGAGALVGATGNWGIPSNVDASYPNPHIRSNAFMIEREHFLRFDPPERTKQSCFEFEAGRNGMTKRVLAGGGRVAVVDRFGRLIAPEDFPQSRTFWSYNQENLLVSDNVTSLYQMAGLRLRKRMAWKFWKDGRHVAPQPFVARYRVAREWETGGNGVPWRFVSSVLTHPRRYL